MKANVKREIEHDMMRGLLQLVVLQYLDEGEMHGYKIIKMLRDEFGVYFGASTVYPLLSDLEEKGYVKSSWDLESERIKKSYTLTAEGRGVKDFSQNSFYDMARKIHSKDPRLQSQKLKEITPLGRDGETSSVY